MRNVRWYVVLRFLLAVVMAGVVPCAGAQEIRLDDGTELRPARAEHVHIDSENFVVTAGKDDWIEVRFQVDAGFHINSHTPQNELLIPTNLQLEATSGVKIVAEEYPAGVPLQLQAGTGETLSTYQGEFRVRVRLAAPRGDAVLRGGLRYQACDSRSCFPPKTLPVRVVVTAR